MSDANEKIEEAYLLLGYHAAVARKFGAPDWDYWLSLPYWTARDVACLLVELNPGRYDMVTADIYPQPRRLAEHIATVERKAAREQEAGSLSANPSPQQWATWAVSNGYALPARLQECKTQKVDAGGTAKRNEWTDDALKTLWEESILPGMTQKKLAEKYGVRHQSISKQLKRAKELFSKTEGKAGKRKTMWSGLS